MMFRNAWLPFFYLTGFQTHPFMNENIYYDAVIIKGSIILVH